MAPDYAKTREDGLATLISGLSVALECEKFTDLKIKLGDRTWPVHKVVVCARSDFFAKACEGKFKESEENLITLHDDDEEIIAEMIRYMYKNVYTDDQTETAPVLFNVRMVAVAEKYFVDHLAHLAASKLQYYVKDNWSTEAFADAIEEAYTTTVDADRQLRDTLLQAITPHMRDMLDADRVEHAHFQKMAAKTPAFALEVAGRLAKMELMWPGTSVYYCPNHGCCGLFQTSMGPYEEVFLTCHDCGKTYKKSYSKWQMFRAKMRTQPVEARLWL